MSGRLDHGRLTGQVVPESEMFGSPGDLLTETDQASGQTAHGQRLLVFMNIGKQMDFDATRQVEHAVDRRVDQRDFFKVDHHWILGWSFPA